MFNVETKNLLKIKTNKVIRINHFNILIDGFTYHISKVSIEKEENRIIIHIPDERKSEKYYFKPNEAEIFLSLFEKELAKYSDYKNIYFSDKSAELDFCVVDDYEINSLIKEVISLFNKLKIDENLEKILFYKENLIRNIQHYIAELEENIGNIKAQLSSSSLIQVEVKSPFESNLNNEIDKEIKIPQFNYSKDTDSLLLRLEDINQLFYDIKDLLLNSNNDLNIFKISSEMENIKKILCYVLTNINDTKERLIKSTNAFVMSSEINKRDETSKNIINQIKLEKLKRKNLEISQFLYDNIAN